nr:hypothetical protein [Bacteroidota bacterium]
MSVRKSDDPDNIELIICTERGSLESMSKLLVYSLREFGGRFRNTPIYSYQPRKRFKISRKTLKFFEKYQVEYIDLDLNKAFDYYPLANKPLVCRHREENTNSEILVFLDSDVFFLNEPSEFIDFQNADVVLRPVDRKGIGTLGKDDANSDYWDQMYKLLNVKVQRKVTSTIDNNSILEYYNTGHIITKTANGLFNAWLSNFIVLMKNGLRPLKEGNYFVEQSTFSATVSQLELKVKLLGKYYNSPIHRQINTTNIDYHIDNFDKLVTVHYHKIFKLNIGKNPLHEHLIKCENGKIINQQLDRFGVIQKNVVARSLFHKIKKGINGILNNPNEKQKEGKTLC